MPLFRSLETAFWIIFGAVCGAAGRRSRRAGRVADEVGSRRTDGNWSCVTPGRHGGPRIGRETPPTGRFPKVPGTGRKAAQGPDRGGPPDLHRAPPPLVPPAR